MINNYPTMADLNGVIAGDSPGSCQSVFIGNPSRLVPLGGQETRRDNITDRLKIVHSSMVDLAETLSTIMTKLGTPEKFTVESYGGHPAPRTAIETVERMESAIRKLKVLGSNIHIEVGG